MGQRDALRYTYLTFPRTMPQVRPTPFAELFQSFLHLLLRIPTWDLINISSCKFSWDFLYGVDKFLLQTLCTFSECITYGRSQGVFKPLRSWNNYINIKSIKIMFEPKSCSHFLNSKFWRFAPLAGKPYTCRISPFTHRTRNKNIRACKYLSHSGNRTWMFWAYWFCFACYQIKTSVKWNCGRFLTIENNIKKPHR